MNIYFVTQTDFNINLDIATWYEMAVELANQGCNVKIIVPEYDSPPEIKHKNVTFVFLTYPRIRYFTTIFFQMSLFVFSLKSLFLRQCDLFLVDPSTVPTLIPFAILKRIGLLKSKFVLDVRSVPVDIYNLRGKIYQMRFNMSVYLAKYLFDGITVITELYRDKFSRDFNISKENMGIWTSGVSLERFNSKIKSSIRKKLNLEDKFVVMYHGGISVSRGIHSLIDAMETVSRGLPDVVLMLVGRGSEDYIKKAVKEKKLEENVIYLDAVSYDNVPEYIVACDIGVLPFPDSIWWRMSSPLKLFEYLAMGKPILLTDIDSHRLLAKETDSLFLIATNSPKDISEGIKKVYDLRETFSQLGMNGIDLIRREGTWRVQAKKLLDYVNTI